MLRIWIEGLIVGLCIAVAALLIQTIITSSLLLRIMLLLLGGVVLVFLQYLVGRFLKLPE